MAPGPESGSPGGEGTELNTPPPFPRGLWEGASRGTQVPGTRPDHKTGGQGLCSKIYPIAVDAPPPWFSC